MIKEDLELLKDRNLSLRKDRGNGKEMVDLINRRRKQLSAETKIAKKEGFKYKINRKFKR